MSVKWMREGKLRKTKLENTSRSFQIRVNKRQELRPSLSFSLLCGYVGMHALVH